MNKEKLRQDTQMPTEKPKQNRQPERISISFGHPLTEELFEKIKIAGESDSPEWRRHAFAVISEQNFNDPRARAFALEALSKEPVQELRILLITYLVSQKDEQVVPFLSKELEIMRNDYISTRQKGEVSYIDYIIFALRKFKHRYLEYLGEFSSFVSTLSRVHSPKTYSMAWDLFKEVYALFEKDRF